MSWETIPDAGKIFTTSTLLQLDEPEGVVATETFLLGFTKAFTEICPRYHSKVDTIPIGDERQTQSAILPAFYQVADAIYVEENINRKKHERKTSAGRIDYWVYYQDFIFLIEFKLSWVYLKNSVRMPAYTCRAWSDALQQLRQISKKDVEYSAMTSGKVLKIALLMVPIYQQSPKKDHFKPFSLSELDEVRQALLTELPVDKPNWICIWDLAEKLRVYLEDDGYEFCPCIGIVARVTPT